MGFLSTTIRSAHLVSNAAWFGGSLMGAVGLNPASREGDDLQERAEISGTGWERWGPVQGAAVGVHLLSGVAILADNRRRTMTHPPTTMAVLLKTGLTAVAVAASAAAYRSGQQLGRAAGEDGRPQDPSRARELSQRMRWLTWATPAATGGLLVLDAYLGEQQRGVAGLLDRRR